ncbi:TPA: hypothetical protein LA827_002840 [Clostridium botulinum]|uniref:Peptidase C39-like domain-containing protein n=1 Tax=Clostridium botulinum TaxID=1491 RepID=A0A126JJ52_CLOBO|nr:hypothetical protein [Clostridium botulinum]ALT05751.1 hypothetical protein [Clostridium botulinum]ALT05853.1 hypothetical protein [Clostridium botulinum]HBJ2623055.1 hypothetical protein [Clostridium botulinum]
MKLLKISVLLIIISCSIISCTNAPNAMQDNTSGEYIVNNNATKFDAIINTFSFNNFSTENSKGYCFGICMAEKCIFEGNLKDYYDQDIYLHQDLYDYDIEDEYFDDNHKLDFSKVPDNTDEKEMLQCINYFQSNQMFLYSTPKLNLRNVIQKLRNNSLVIIILNYGNNSKHAVLAYGYKLSDDKNEVKIYIADPNKSNKCSKELSNSIDFKYEYLKWNYCHENNSDFKLYIADLNHDI